MSLCHSRRLAIKPINTRENTHIRCFKSSAMLSIIYRKVWQHQDAPDNILNTLSIRSGHGKSKKKVLKNKVFHPLSDTITHMTDNHATCVEIIPHTTAWPPQSEDLFGRDATRFIPGNSKHNDQPSLASPDTPLPHLIGYFEDKTLIAGLLYLQYPGHGAIHHLIIPPQHRGKGIAGLLLRRAVSLAKSHSAAYLLTTAGFGCHDPMNMYGRLGFEPTPNHPPYLMIRHLSID